MQLEDEQVRGLDAAARELGVSRAAFVRALVDQALADNRRRAEVAAIVQSYRQTPPENHTASKRAMRRAWPR